MAIEDINLGTSAGDGTGDSLRVAGQKINDNFTELDTELKLADIFEVERDANQNITKTVSLHDLQVPPESIEIGNAIKLSDLAQSVGYKTAFDNKQFVLMSYEIEDDGSKNPFIKDFGSSSEYVIQDGFDTTETFAGFASFPLTSQQNVIAKTYNLKLYSTADVQLNVIRVAENGGVDTVIVNEILPASSTNLDGFDFDISPLTDFESGAEYLLQFSTPNNEDIKVMGVNVHATFKPYVKRVKGWEYVKREVAFKDDVNRDVNNNSNVGTNIDFFQVQDNSGVGQILTKTHQDLQGIWGTPYQGNGFNFNGTELTITEDSDAIEFNCSIQGISNSNNRVELGLILLQDDGNGYIELTKISQYALRNTELNEGNVNLVSFLVFNVSAGAKFKLQAIRQGVEAIIGTQGGTYFNAKRYS